MSTTNSICSPLSGENSPAKSLAVPPGRVEPAKGGTPRPYTHAIHARRCREAAQAGQTLAGQFVQVRLARTPVCAQIVTAWDTSDGLEMWQLDLLGPIKGRMSMPAHQVRQCSGLDGRCSCAPAEGLGGPICGGFAAASDRPEGVTC